MVLTVQQQEALDKAAESLKEGVIKKARDERDGLEQKMRKELADKRLEADAIALETIKRKGFTQNERGQQITLWDDMKQKADHAIHSEQHAYNDWRSAMMSLWSVMCKALFEAVNQSKERFLAENQIVQLIKVRFREGVVYALKDYLLDKMRGDPAIPLPALKSHFSISDDNKLEVKPLVNAANNEPLSDEANAAFKVLITTGLAGLGFKPSDVPGQFVSTDGNNRVLTKQEFDGLRDELDEFLEEQTDLQLDFDEAPSP